MITKPHPPFVYHTKPYKHQDDDFIRSRDLQAFAMFSEMGTGKSKPLLDTAVHLFLKKEIDGVLIVSDKGCYLNWHHDQIPIHISPDIPVRKAYYASSMDKQTQRKLAEVMEPQDDVLDILCLNVESLSHGAGIQAAERFIRNHWSMMIVDESTSIKNLKAKRTKNCIALGRLAEYRRIATGTPVTQSPLDLYAQAEFLRSGLLGFNSFVTFKGYYAVVREVIQGRARYEQILGYRNLDALTRSIQPWSVRRLKSECLDLPEKIYETVYVEQTTQQRDAYRRLKQEALLQLGSGLITITSALTLLTKLHQTNCGHVTDDDGTTHQLESNRGSGLLELCDRIPGKIVIWGYYKEDIRIICRMFDEHYGHQSYVTYYGDTDAGDRPGNISRFINAVDCRFFVGTPATGGKGINGLTVAHTCIYYSNHYNLERRLQSEDRLHRIGQKSNVTYIDMVCPKTVDVEIVQALRDKRDLATEVLDNLRKVLEADNL